MHYVLWDMQLTSRNNIYYLGHAPYLYSIHMAMIGTGILMRVHAHTQYTALGRCDFPLTSPPPWQK